MYDYNNIDKSKEDGLQEWYQTLTSTPHSRNPYNENRVTLILQEIWERIKPTYSTKGTSKYHR
mgnify:CR=1 FL=1